jgi:fido (protein-threonine AMPylation protein)
VLGAINRKIDHLMIAQDFVVQTMAFNARAEGVSISPPPSRPDLFLGGTYRAPPDARGFSADTDTTQLLALHRAICFDAPTNEVGRLRDRQVYLARPGGAADQAVALPPKPEDVPDALTALCKDWTNGIAALNTAGAEGRLQAIARFHAEFLRIHPFADGNGRVARFLLMQECLDLFGVADMGVLDKGAEYYAALQSAHHDDVAALVKLICPIVGIESDAE